MDHVTYGKEFREFIILRLIDITFKYENLPSYERATLSTYNPETSLSGLGYCVTDGTPSVSEVTNAPFDKMYFYQTEIESLVIDDKRFYTKE